jgi:hypothetical protein
MKFTNVEQACKIKLGTIYYQTWKIPLLDILINVGAKERKWITFLNLLFEF